MMDRPRERRSALATTIGMARAALDGRGPAMRASGRFAVAPPSAAAGGGHGLAADAVGLVRPLADADRETLLCQAPVHHGAALAARQVAAAVTFDGDGLAHTRILGGPRHLARSGKHGRARIPPAPLERHPPSVRSDEVVHALRAPRPDRTGLDGWRIVEQGRRHCQSRSMPVAVENRVRSPTVASYTSRSYASSTSSPSVSSCSANCRLDLNSFIPGPGRSP